MSQPVKNYMTPKGAQKLREELSFLLKTERPKVVETVSWAASNGDRSENGDYIYGKKRLREIDRRIRFLTQRLDHVQIVAPETQNSDTVLFGATVKIRHESGIERKYQIVGIDEAEPKMGKVSWISPIAKALLGKKEGEVVNLRTPKSIEELEILKIEYKEID